MPRSFHRFKLILLTFFASTYALAAPSLPITEVYWHTPHDWDKYIDAEGRGLYVDIMERVFRAAHVKLLRRNVPWRRALNDVLIGEADVTGGISISTQYAQSRFPLFESGEYAFYRKKSFLGARWPDDLAQHRGVWTHGYIDAFPTDLRARMKGVGVASRAQAARMVLAGRADYYIDNPNQMYDTLSSLSYKSQDFDCMEIDRSEIYMTFTLSPRGRAIRDIYDTQVEKLVANGELRQLYAKYQLDFPPSLLPKTTPPIIIPPEKACPEKVGTAKR